MSKLEPSRTEALLDMGCGAGRAICVAAQYPFARVIGIEIDERLCAILGVRGAAMGIRTICEFA
jgi:cyclopropane fatty-acyl-phospholipid synthase-like methyltransferase